jgi:hypothetical protein
VEGCLTSATLAGTTVAIGPTYSPASLWPPSPCSAAWGGALAFFPRCDEGGSSFGSLLAWRAGWRPPSLLSGVFQQGSMASYLLATSMSVIVSRCQIWPVSACFGPSAPGDGEVGGSCVPVAMLFARGAWASGIVGWRY